MQPAIRHSPPRPPCFQQSPFRIQVVVQPATEHGFFFPPPCLMQCSKPRAAGVEHPSTLHHPYAPYLQHRSRAIRAAFKAAHFGPAMLPAEPHANRGGGAANHGARLLLLPTAVFDAMLESSCCRGEAPIDLAPAVRTMLAATVTSNSNSGAARYRARRPLLPTMCHAMLESTACSEGASRKFAPSVRTMLDASTLCSSKRLAAFKIAHFCPTATMSRAQSSCHGGSRAIIKRSDHIDALLPAQLTTVLGSCTAAFDRAQLCAMCSTDGIAVGRIGAPVNYAH